MRCRREGLGTIGENCEMICELLWLFGGTGTVGLGLRLGLGLGLGLRFGLSGVDWEIGIGASLDGSLGLAWHGLAWTGLDDGRLDWHRF